MKSSTVVIGIVATMIVLASIVYYATADSRRRNVVRDVDYRTMEQLFDTTPLPPSFKIEQVQYRGYSYVFNGPDGPAYSSYQIALDAQDLGALSAKLAPFRASQPNPRYREAIREFDQDFIIRYEDDGQTARYASYMVLRGGKGTGGYKDASWLVIDDRTSPALKLYVSTRLYCFM